MKELIKKKPDNMHIYWGALLLFIMLFTLTFPIEKLSYIKNNEVLHYASGILLLVTFMWQWKLCIKRYVLRKPSGNDTKSHKFLGTLSMVLYIIHARYIGHNLLYLLSILFIVAAFIGTFYKLILNLNKKHCH